MPGLRFIIFAITVWAFFSTTTAGTVYLAVCGILLSYVLVLQSSGSKSDLHSNKYSDEDNQLFKRYNVFFRYPITSRMISAQLSGIQITAWVMIALFAFNALFVHLVVAIVLLIGSSFMAPKMNPQLFKSNVAKRGNYEAQIELEAINDLLRRLHNIPDEVINAHHEK